MPGKKTEAKTAKELIARSKETLVKEREAVALKLKELGVEDEDMVTKVFDKCLETFDFKSLRKYFRKVK